MQGFLLMKTEPSGVIVNGKTLTSHFLSRGDPIRTASLKSERPAAMSRTERERKQRRNSLMALASHSLSPCENLFAVKSALTYLPGQPDGQLGPEGLGWGARFRHVDFMRGPFAE